MTVSGDKVRALFQRWKTNKSRVMVGFWLAPSSLHGHLNGTVSVVEESLVVIGSDSKCSLQFSLDGCVFDFMTVSATDLIDLADTEVDLSIRFPTGERCVFHVLARPN
jgi:hypothetical protein